VKLAAVLPADLAEDRAVARAYMIQVARDHDAVIVGDVTVRKLAPRVVTVNDERLSADWPETPEPLLCRVEVHARPNHPDYSAGTLRHDFPASIDAVTATEFCLGLTSE